MKFTTLFFVSLLFLFTGCAAITGEFIKIDSETHDAMMAIGDDLSRNWSGNSGIWHCATGLPDIGLPIDTPQKLAVILNNADLNATIMMADVMIKTMPKNSSDPNCKDPKSDLCLKYWNQDDYNKGCIIGYAIRADADVLMAALEEIGGKAAAVVAKSGGTSGFLGKSIKKKLIELKQKK